MARVRDPDPGQLIKWYVSRDAPVIVEDGTRDWERIANFTSLAAFAKVRRLNLSGLIEKRQIPIYSNYQESHLVLTFGFGTK